MKNKISTILLLSISLISCGEIAESERETDTVKISPAEVTFQNKGHELVYNMTQKVGTYQDLLDKKDVSYTYTYTTPDGKSDIMNEKYLFDGQLSYAKYQQHDRTFPDLVGEIEQGYDGNEFWLKHEGQIIDDADRIKRVTFNRATNFYWFAMFQKLMDPGLNYEYIGEQNIDNNPYDVVKVTFESPNGKPTDIYQLYINKETSLVDQFLFTVADFGKMEVPNLMQMKYEEVDGMLIPTVRQYKKSTWDATVSEEPWIYVTWTDITFNNGLTKEHFTK